MVAYYRPNFSGTPSTPQTPPSNPTITVNSTDVSLGSAVTFNFNADGATSYMIGIDRQNPEGTWSRVVTETVSSGCSFTLEGGIYSAYVTARNSAGHRDSDRVHFNVGMVHGSRSVSGDFNGDGRDDYATMYDFNNGKTQIHVFLSAGGQFSEEIWFDAPSGFTAPRVTGRMVAGDFNGDGLDDIAVMYDYGNGQMRIFTWLSNGNGFNYYQTWFDSPEGTFHALWATGRMVAGDFNGDGLCDISVMYDYGNGQMRIFTFLSNGTGFGNRQTWYDAPSGFTASRVTGRMVAGDFNGDGKDDIAVMYDYGNGQMRIFTFLSNGSGFNSYQTWFDAPEGTFHASWATGRMVAGDFSGDGLDDIAVMYDYGNGQTRIFTFLSSGTGFSNRQTWYDAPAGTYNASWTTGRMVAGDFNGDGLDDIAVMYDYHSSYIRLHVFTSDQTKFTMVQRNRIDNYNAKRTVGFSGSGNYSARFAFSRIEIIVENPCRCGDCEKCGFITIPCECGVCEDCRPLYPLR
jgi:hypothetical protein